MKKTILSLATLLLSMSMMAQTQVKTAEGILEGKDLSGITIFKGVPFAAPPVGNLRWKAPQPVQKWEGVRKATEYGPNPMQEALFGDMNFGTKVNSEDCLYLNIWTPAKTMKEHLPVLIYFNGGGLMAGSGSEPRYAGDAMARKGIISITAKKVNVIDTTGAGDAFFAGTVIGRAYGKTMAEACGIGSRLAAWVICTAENVCPRFRPQEFGLDVPVVD